MNPRTERAREAVISATISLVSEKPVSEISITEIADAAGVSRPVIYNQFGDAPNLVACAALDLMQQAFVYIDECLADAPNDESRLQLIMSIFVNFVHEHRTFCRNAMRGPSSAAITESVVNLLTNLMANGIVGKRMRALPNNGEDSLHAISAGVIWLLTLWLDSDFTGENAPERMAQRFTDTILQLSKI